MDLDGVEGCPTCTICNLRVLELVGEGLEILCKDNIAEYGNVRPPHKGSLRACAELDTDIEPVIRPFGFLPPESSEPETSPPVFCGRSKNAEDKNGTRRPS
eukprot:3072012-Pyramimonas_sp.AAC.1